MGLAGLGSCWKSPDGDVVHSFSMLTINADAHSLMRLFHRPVDEKRMVVVRPEERYDDWLNAQPDHTGLGCWLYWVSIQPLFFGP